MLLTVLALGEGNSPDDLELARQLAEALLQCGNNRTEYRAMVQDLEELLVGSPSINTLSWALDAAEVLAINPAPDLESRLRFFMKVLELAQTTSHRVKIAHRTALGLLRKDFGVEFPSTLSASGGIYGRAGSADFHRETGIHLYPNRTSREKSRRHVAADLPRSGSRHQLR